MYIILNQFPQVGLHCILVCYLPHTVFSSFRFSPNDGKRIRTSEGEELDIEYKLKQ